jgi:hypothetical protein
MPWPTLTDYQEAIQNPRLCFSDPELAQAAPSLDRLGLPKPITGGFASVYQLARREKRWAVRCFLHEFQDHQRRYEAISRHLTKCNLQCKVDFVFLAQGIRVHGRWYPILKMEWIEGQPLNSYIERKLPDREALRRLAHAWREFIGELKRHRIAHGDLQHGNVLLQSGGFKLIDYDGMFVPAFRGLGSHEAGHPAYQHPRRSSTDFGLYIDNFAALVIYVAVLALAVRPELWQQFDNGDNLLFCQEDFRNPAQSRLFAELRSLPDPQIRNSVRTLQSACTRELTQVPEIDRAVLGGLPAWVEDWIAAPPQESTLAQEIAEPGMVFVPIWTRPGPRRRKRIRQEPVYQEYTYRIVLPGWWGWLGYTFTAAAYEEQIDTQLIEEWVIQQHVPVLGHRGPVLAVSFSQDGRFVLSGGEDTCVYVWDRDSGDKHREIAVHAQKITALAGAPGGMVITASEDRTLRVWGARDRPKQLLHSPTLSLFCSLALSPDGRRIAAGTENGQICVWDMATGIRQADLRGHTQRVLALAFFPDSKRLVSASSDRSLRLWNIDGSSCERVLYGHQGAVNCVAVSPEGKTMASGASDGLILLWEAQTGQLKRRIRCSSQDICIGLLCGWEESYIGRG